jgi:hypothetical protein
MEHLCAKSEIPSTPDPLNIGTIAPEGFQEIDELEKYSFLDANIAKSCLPVFLKQQKYIKCSGALIVLIFLL